MLYAEAMSRIKTYVILAVAGGGIAIGVYLSFNGRPDVGGLILLASGLGIWQALKQRTPFPGGN